MAPPATPYQPYAAVHQDTKGPGDARPTAMQIIRDCNVEGKLRNKTILITGCSSGLGVETARALYATGARLFLTARDMPKLEKVIEDIVAGAEIKDVARPVGIEMHLDSLQSVREGAESFLKLSKSLNILICNAGIMACPYSKTQDGFESQIGTNHMAHFLLFELLRPVLLTSAETSGTTSRIITLSSAGHRRGGIRFDDMHFTRDPSSYNKWVSYGQSKTANILMANGIARYYGKKGLTGLSVHPGGIMTELGRHLDQSDYALFGDMEKFQALLKSPEQGAATTVWAAVDPRFEDVENGGRLLGDVGEAGPLKESDVVAAPTYAPWAYDEQSEDRLWKVSCEAVEVPYDV